MWRVLTILLLAVAFVIGGIGCLEGDDHHADCDPGCSAACGCYLPGAEPPADEGVPAPAAVAVNRHPLVARYGPQLQGGDIFRPPIA